jgi:ParB family chromosome partitioning protein
VSAKQQKGLGKGFDILMPSGVGESLLNRGDDRVQNVFITSISANPDQPRRTFDDQALNELADSIKQHGVLQPLLVSPKGAGQYVIIAGERRWRASKLAGLDKVPAIVRTAEELEQLELAMVENIQRVDLAPLEQAATISRLHELFHISMEEISKRLGKAPSTVANILRLLQLPPAAQEALQSGRITEGHARAVLALKDYPEQQQQLLLLIQKQGWSVRQAEQFVVATKSDAKSPDKAEKRTAEKTPETEQLSKILKRDVTVKHMAKGGRLVIRFKTDDDLENLIELLGSIK